MIDDAKVRLQILKNIPTLPPRNIEMEEIDFGDKIGASVLIDGVRQRFQTPAFDIIGGQRIYKPESDIADELTLQIKRALMDEITPTRGKPASTD